MSSVQKSQPQISSETYAWVTPWYIMYGASIFLLIIGVGIACLLWEQPHFIVKTPVVLRSVLGVLAGVFILIPFLPNSKKDAYSFVADPIGIYFPKPVKSEWLLVPWSRVLDMKYIPLTNLDQLVFTVQIDIEHYREFFPGRELFDMLLDSGEEVKRQTIVLTERSNGRAKEALAKLHPMFSSQ